MSKAGDYFERRDEDERKWNKVSKTPPWNGEGHVDPENKGVVPPYEPYEPKDDEKPEEPADPPQS